MIYEAMFAPWKYLCRALERFLPIVPTGSVAHSNSPVSRLPVSITRLPNFPTYFPAEERIFLRAFKTFLIALTGLAGHASCERCCSCSFRLNILLLQGEKGEKCLRRN